MKTSQEINNFFGAFIKQNTSDYGDCAGILTNFRKQEIYLSSYNESLVELEAISQKIRLDDYEAVYEYILSVLINFNTQDLAANTRNIEALIQSFDEYSKEFISATNLLRETMRVWDKFLENESELINSSLDKEIRENILSIKTLSRKINIGLISQVQYAANECRDKIDDLITAINTLKKYRQQYIYRGDEAKSLLEKLDMLWENKDNCSVADFPNRVYELIKQIDIIIVNSKMKRVAIPVYRVSHKEMGGFSCHTLKFADNYVAYSEFLKMAIQNSDGFVFENTGTFVYLANMMDENGIYYGELYAARLRYDFNYLDACINTIKKYRSGVLWVTAIIIMVLSLSFFINGVGLLLLSLSALMFVGLYIYIQRLRDNAGKEFKLKNICIPSPQYLITYYQLADPKATISLGISLGQEEIYDMGVDLDLELALNEALRTCEDTLFKV